MGQATTQRSTPEELPFILTCFGSAGLALPCPGEG